MVNQVPLARSIKVPTIQYRFSIGSSRPYNADCLARDNAYKAYITTVAKYHYSECFVCKYYHWGSWSLCNGDRFMPILRYLPDLSALCPNCDQHRTNLHRCPWKFHCLHGRISIMQSPLATKQNNSSSFREIAVRVAKWSTRSRATYKKTNDILNCNFTNVLFNLSILLLYCIILQHSVQLLAIILTQEYR